MSVKGKAVAVGVIAVMAGMSQGHGGPVHAILTDVHLGGSFNTVAWDRTFLRSAGLPRTRCNLRFTAAWVHAEGTYGQFNNPLDSTQTEPGSYPVNSVGVQHYTSLSQGLHATVVTLYNGRYPNIIAALRAGDDAQAAANAVQSSPWGTAPFQASC